MKTDRRCRPHRLDVDLKSSQISIVGEERLTLGIVRDERFLRQQVREMAEREIYT